MAGLPLGVHPLLPLTTGVYEDAPPPQPTHHDVYSGRQLGHHAHTGVGLCEEGWLSWRQPGA